MEQQTPPAAPPATDQPATTAETVETPTPTQTEIQKYKVKVDGQEHDITIDELIKGYQVQSAASRRMTEAQKLREETTKQQQQLQQLVNLAKQDPKKFLSHPEIGVNVKDWALEVLAKEMEIEMMTPEQKELAEAKRKLQELEEQKKQQEAEAQEKQIQQLVDHYQQDYYVKITSALEASNLPKTNHTVKRMAYYLNQGLTHGIDVPMNEVVELVRQDYITEINSLFGTADEEVLMNMLGEANVNKIAKGHVNKLNKNKPKPPTTEEQPVATKPKPQGKVVNAARSELDELYERSRRKRN